MDDPVRVSLLGPFEVCTDGRAVPVAGVKQQSLLALLALSTPHVVPDDRLVDELWGDDQPANPANALQALVSHLRRLLGRDVVARQGPGYVLRLDPDMIDVLRLERLVEQARTALARADHAGAAARFRAAVDLVRGPPLGDLPDSWFARDASARLEDLVLSAREGLIDCELSMGRHGDVLPALLELVGRYPLRERFRAQLIVTLYRSGRQADALQAYRDAREFLLDELGLDPGPELQALERAVLAHDPALAAPIALIPSTPSRAVAPVPLTSFIGRSHEIEALDCAVASSRLTSIVGPGGVGKTRIVLEFIRRYAERGEVWFVELAPVTRPAAVAEAVAAGVGAQERAPVAGQPAPTPEQRAIERLGQRDAVVVLDNCEHVVATASAVVLALLAGCPRIRVVTTSREPLGIEGEQHVLIGPLDDEESAQLFAERAKAVQPLFTPGGGRELVELCRRLDGLPLAIELAAARTKTLPVPEISIRLRDRFQLLRSTQRVSTSRHEGLEAAIAWSYELLFDEERRMFRRLAVFSGGATVEATEQMCGVDAFEVASRLVDRSLLVADTSGRATRFRMLESLRAYGLERLAEAGELIAAKDDHLRWCVELAEHVDLETRRADQIEWLARLDDEHDNMSAALGHAVVHDPAGALRLLAALILPWWYRGRRQETRRWTDATLAAGGDQAPQLRARVLSLSGLVAEPSSASAVLGGGGDEVHQTLVVAEQRQREALAIFLAGDDERETAQARLLLLATLARRASAGDAIDRAEVHALVAAAAATFDEFGDDHGSGVVRVTDAMFAVMFGDIERAAASVDAAVPFARRSGDRFTASRIEYVLGLLDDLAGDPHSAYRHIERGLRLFDELGVHQAVTSQARLLGPLAERCGEPELAAQWRAFVNDRGDGWTRYDGAVMASARNREGIDARAAGDLDRAAAAHRSALEWYASAGIPAGVAFAESCLGFLAAEQGDREQAVCHHAAALAAAAEADDPSLLALALAGGAQSSPDRVKATMLLGAAGAIRAAADASGTEPTHRADESRIRDAARRALGDDAFHSALAAGEMLDRRGALALARAQFAAVQQPGPERHTPSRRSEGHANLRR